MAIDRSVVEKAAGLARIALTEDEVERFTGQLSVVLKAVERLKEVDTEKVSPTASVLPVSNVMRRTRSAQDFRAKRPSPMPRRAGATASSSACSRSWKSGHDGAAALDQRGERAPARAKGERPRARRARVGSISSRPS